MSPKVNRSRLYGCFKMSQIQKSCSRTKSSKQMIACFFGKTGHIAIAPLEQRRTVNSGCYTTICLPVVFQEIRKTNRRRRITLHHDNGSSHTSAQTTEFLSTQNINLMSNPPYVLTWHRMTSFYSRTTSEGAADAFRMHVLEIPQSEWQKCFDNWFKRIQMFININVEYFEKQ